jgi:hypothetical protein
MFPGSPAPLRAAIRLQPLTGLAHPREMLGVWLRDCRKPCPIRTGVRPGRLLLVASDLGFLLHRCARVAVWDDGLVVLESTRLIRCRVLQILLGTPYLPPPGQLRALYPSLHVEGHTLAVPIGLGSAEEALSLCATDKIRVLGSRIGYHAFSG